SEASLAAMTIDDVRAFHERAVRPPTATLIAVGDCEHEAIVRTLAEAFADWTGDGDQEVTGVEPPPHDASIAVLPRPEPQQSEPRMGQVPVARNTPDYHALLVANPILGGQFVSRINLNLREHKGLTSGARTAFEFKRMAGPFAMQVSVQTSGTAVAIA